MIRNLDEEQIEMVNLVNSLKHELPRLLNRNRAWNKYVGCQTNNTLIKYLNTHIADGFRAVGPSVFIENAPTEFDSLIVKGEDKSLTNIRAYPRPSVEIAIEVKDRGLFDKKIEAEMKLLGRMQRIEQTCKAYLICILLFMKVKR